jgi:hypothetical protein
MGVDGDDDVARGEAGPGSRALGRHGHDLQVFQLEAEPPLSVVAGGSGRG